MLGGFIDSKLAAAGLIAFLLGSGVAAVVPAGLGPGAAVQAGCTSLDEGGQRLDAERSERSAHQSGDHVARSIRWSLDGVEAARGVASLCVDVGSIEVTPSGGDEVRLQAVMLAHGDDAAERVGGMEVEAAFVDTGSGLGIAVGQVGQAPDVEHPYQAHQGVRLVLELPAGMPWSLEASAGVGEVEVDELTLDRLEVDLGTGELDTGNVATRGDVDVTVTTGEIDLEVRPEADGRYTLDVGTGEIDVEVPQDGRVGYEASAETGAGGVDLDIDPTEDERHTEDEHGPSEHGYARSQGFASGEVKVRLTLTASVGEIDVTAGS